MITREDIRELASFHCEEGCALSFYFQPSLPQNKSHREEAILAKDLVRQAMRESQKEGRNGHARADLERVLQVAENLHGNQRRAKAVFACSSRNFWREFDLPARLAGTRLALNQRFQLRPLTALADVLPRVCIALVDRSKARLLELWMDEIHEREKFSWELPRHGRSDGFLGYDAGHAERHVEHEAMHHFKQVADRLRELQEAGRYERFVIGCRDDIWPELERHLHPYVRQRLVARFSADLATASPEQVREQAESLLSQFRAERRQSLVREVIGEAQRNGRGALGLRRVLRSLQTGEVQTLLLGQTFSAPSVQCIHCGHVDNHMVKVCAVCGQPTAELADVADFLLRMAVRNGIEIVHIGDDPEFDHIGNVAALLRFRADQNTEVKKAG